MTVDRDLSSLLDRWLDEGPTTATDRVLFAVEDRISHVDQIPAWRLRTWRAPSMSPLIRLAAAVALVAVVALGVLITTGGPAPGPSPSPSPSQAPSPSPSASSAAVVPTAAPSADSSPDITPQPSITCRSPQAPACQGRLEPGTHDSVLFQPPFSYTVPADWWSLDSHSNIYQFHRFGDAADQQILMFQDPGIPPPDDDCEGTAIPGEDATVEDWVSFLTSHPGLDTSEPATIDLGRGTARWVDIAVRDDWTRPCPFSEGRPFVRYATDIYYPFEGWGIADKQRKRVFVTESPRGVIVLMEISTNTPEPFAAFVEAAQPIVASITFKE